MTKVAPACLLVWLMLLHVQLVAALPTGCTQANPPRLLQQPQCTQPDQHNATPFPISFWLVKTIKTGGTTLASVLRNICNEYGVVPVKKRRINPLESMPDAASAAALGKLVSEAAGATDANAYAIITHLNFSAAKYAAFSAAINNNAGNSSSSSSSSSAPRTAPLLLTSVRHPLARTYSHFIQAKCANAAAVLRGKIIECDRNATFMDKALELDTVRNRWNFVRSPARHNAVFNYIRGNASSAEAAVRRYDFVFVSERLDEALVVFMLQYGLRLSDIAYLPSKNRTGRYKPASTMPPELNAYVLAHNTHDLAVWQHANKLLDCRVERLRELCGGNAVQSAMAAFRQMQAEVARECTNFKAWYAKHNLPAQFTYVNDEGWGWRCVRHVAQLFMERGGVGGAAKAPKAPTAVVPAIS